MVHASPQFTPAQLLDSGRRAEAEGKLDLAAQFYQHLTQHHAYTAEAAEARNGIGRLGVAQSHVWHPGNGVHLNDGPVSVEAGHRKQMSRLRRKPVSPRDHYRTGRFMARLFSGLGWLMVVMGIVSPALHFLPGLLPPLFDFGTIIAGAAGLLISGLLVVFFGQIARALFDQANATRDLAALERAKLAGD